MKNHWLEKSKELTERQKGLLTLLVDKMVEHGQMMGAHRNQNWLTNTTYENSDVQKMQGVFDRIGRIEYMQTFLVDDKKHCPFTNPCYLGEEFYSHSIRCYWRELFGKGDDNLAECLKTIYKQDKAGRWHAPCDEGMWIKLWHPSEQPLQERIHECWNLLGNGPYWRPVYNYTKDEVVESLQIMCDTFDWEFKDAGLTTTIIFR